MTAKRLVLAEDDINLEDVTLTLPEDDDILVIDTPEEELPIEEPVIEEPVMNQSQMAVNAYTDLLQDLLRKQWDVINSADGIMATISAEETDAGMNKEDVIKILQGLVEESTKSVGMITKALGVVDQEQEDLMAQGVREAERLIGKDEPEEAPVEIVEPVEEPVEECKLTEDASDWRAVDFSDSDYYDRFWQEECFYQLQYFWENAEDYADDENIQELDNLSTEEIKDIIIDAASEVRNSDYLWEEINERIQDEVKDALARHLSEIRDTPSVDIGTNDSVGEINIEGTIEGE